MSGFIEKTLGGLLDGCAASHGNVEALIAPQRGVRLTYRELNEVCRRTAKGLLRIGVKKGGHVAVWATNYPEWVILMFAAAKIGAVLVTVNTGYKIFEAKYLLKQSDTHTLVMSSGCKDSDYVAILNEICPELKDAAPGALRAKELPFLKNVVCLDETDFPGSMRWDDMMKLGEGVSDAELDAAQAATDARDVVNMQYTSGTTGFPKGVMLTHHSIINNGLAIGGRMNLSPADRLLIHVPLFHCFGCVLGVMSCVTHCAAMVLLDHYNPVTAMQTIQAEKCTAAHGVPTMFIMMLEHEDFHKYDFSALRTGIMAGSPCPIEIMKQAVDKMNMREIVITYGQTESSPAITMTATTDPLEKRVATVGKKIEHVEVKIVDPETGEEVGAGVSGELCSRGYNTMKGYYKMPEATAAAIDADGWLHTGDLAVMDADGYYKISGRIKDMIIRGGENIYPREIEELIYTHPSVSDVQVVGAPSAALGEEAAAFVILKEGETLTEDEMKAFVKANMARHKVPKYVLFVESFPLTSSGKIQKYKLREQAIEALGLEDAARIETA
jgi:fatty-acyl-CoA synthase